MNVAPLEVEPFLTGGDGSRTVDVRTPSEFEHGHIPGAENVPLFSDAERAEIGTLYKRSGRHEAMMRSLDLVGPKMRGFVERLGAEDSGRCLLYCWRGGMRSASVATLLAFFGRDVGVLRGGYKAYRRHVLRSFAQPRRLIVIGGRTGSGKTALLGELKRRGHQILDLEGLAQHKGSAFGALGEEPQPSQEQFENLTSSALSRLDSSRTIWVEDESRAIGRCMIPSELWLQMSDAPVLFLDVATEPRLEEIIRGYGVFDPQEISESIMRIQRRLGGLNTRTALEAAARGDVRETARILLEYYDAAYLHALKKRVGRHVAPVACSNVDPQENAERVIARAGAMGLLPDLENHPRISL